MFVTLGLLDRKVERAQDVGQRQLFRHVEDVGLVQSEPIGAVAVLDCPVDHLAVNVDTMCVSLDVACDPLVAQERRATEILAQDQRFGRRALDSGVGLEVEFLQVAHLVGGRLHRLLVQRMPVVLVRVAAIALCVLVLLVLRRIVLLVRRRIDRDRIFRLTPVRMRLLLVLVVVVVVLAVVVPVTPTAPRRSRGTPLNVSFAHDVILAACSLETLVTKTVTGLFFITQWVSRYDEPRELRVGPRLNHSVGGGRVGVGDEGNKREEEEAQ